MKGSVKLIIFVSACLGAVLAQSDLEGAENARQVADSNNKFSSKFYQILSTKTDGNILYSPYSLSSALAMLYAGARENTAMEIQRGMEFPSADKLFSGYRALSAQLKSNENYTLDVANSIFPAQGFNMNPDFTRTLEQSFNAETKQMDYSNPPQSSKYINGWVESHTGGKIKDLITADSISMDTRLILVNAIYFKGLWENKFDKELTTKNDFFITETEKVSVDFMRNEADYMYAEIPELGAKAVAMAYRGEHLSMLVLLPNEISGLKSMEEKLQTFDINQITSRLRKRKVVVVMPKFRIESTIDLKEPLKELGLKSVFEDSANLKGIPAPGERVDLKVSKATTKVFLEVNEEGSEAAAATGFQVTLKSFRISPTIRADHPFMAIIYTNVTTPIGSTLFVTSMRNPTQGHNEIKPSARLSQGNNHDHQGHEHANKLGNNAFSFAPLISLYLVSALLTAFRFIM